MVALLWAGIDALFGISAELRYRLATYMAAVLQPRGKERKSLYGKAKLLYDVRSKAVHGVRVSNDSLREHIGEVKMLLSRLLCAFTERKHLPTESEIEDLVFT